MDPEDKECCNNDCGCHGEEETLGRGNAAYGGHGALPVEKEEGETDKEYRDRLGL